MADTNCVSILARNENELRESLLEGFAVMNVIQKKRALSGLDAFGVRHIITAAECRGAAIEEIQTMLRDHSEGCSESYGILCKERAHVVVDTSSIGNAVRKLR